MRHRETTARQPRAGFLHWAAGPGLFLAGAGTCILLASSGLGPGAVAVRAALLSPLPSSSLPAVTLPPVLPTVTPPALPKVTPPQLPKLTPLPTPTLSPLPSLPPSLPPILPTPLPSPTLPISLTPSPSVPPLLGTPTPSAPAAPGSGGSGGSGTTGSDGGGGTGGGIHIPFTPFVIRTPLDAALLGALAVLPLLLGLWVLLFGRTWVEARRARDAQVRLALAHDLGMSPRELLSVSTKGLFKLREETAFDDLTGVMRRAAGIAAIDREISRARRQKTPLAVAFIDIDGLKEANDKRGHNAGDELIRGLAQALQGGLRGQDLVLRYGGDEFVCVLPDAAADAARAKMSWIQAETEKLGISFSVGVAALERSDDVVSLLGRADSEMYAVKSRRHKVRDLRLGVVGRGPRRETA